MNKKTLLYIWGGLFILCAGLGFIQEPSGSLRILLRILSLIFFLPPAVLLYESRKGNPGMVLLIRHLSISSLCLTLGMMLLNILSAVWPIPVGDFLNGVLIIVSSPMFCCGNWFLSMFLWACLMMSTFLILKKK